MSPTLRTIGMRLAAGVLTASCHAEQGADDSSSAISYHYVTHRETIEDSDSPLGYWQIDHRYPVFESEGHASLATAINRDIAHKMAEYRCPDGGDQTFTAELETTEPGTLLIVYEAMWLCPAMPAPDSTSGSLRFQLPGNGERLQPAATAPTEA